MNQINQEDNEKGLHILLPKEEAARRYDICKQCDRLYKPTMTCKECGCFMKIKTKIKFASCPLRKW
jgi:hypothetical protein